MTMIPDSLRTSFDGTRKVLRAIQILWKALGFEGYAKPDGYLPNGRLDAYANCIPTLASVALGESAYLSEDVEQAFLTWAQCVYHNVYLPVPKEFVRPDGRPYDPGALLVGLGALALHRWRDGGNGLKELPMVAFPGELQPGEEGTARLALMRNPGFSSGALPAFSVGFDGTMKDWAILGPRYVVDWPDEDVFLPFRASPSGDYALNNFQGHREHRVLSTARPRIGAHGFRLLVPTRAVDACWEGWGERFRDVVPRAHTVRELMGEHRAAFSSGVGLRAWGLWGEDRQYTLPDRRWIGVFEGLGKELGDVVAFVLAGSKGAAHASDTRIPKALALAVLALGARWWLL
jgi:hypothetical protein